jgi:hypothetical protein
MLIANKPFVLNLKTSEEKKKSNLNSGLVFKIPDNKNVLLTSEVPESQLSSLLYKPSE